MNLLARFTFSSVVVAALAGCGGGGAATTGSASSNPAGSSAPAGAAAPASAAPEAPPAAVTKGEVEMRNRKKVGYSIEVPEGLKDFSDSPGVKRYAKEEKKYDGYSLQIMEANPKWATLGLDKMVEQQDKDPDAVKNKAKILDKGTTSDGWYMASSIEEGTKKAVILISIVEKGDIKLMCRGNVEGPLADKPDDAASVIVKACKSLKITT